MMNEYLAAFIIGGCICIIGQLLMDLTKLTPAHVLVLFVTTGTLLGGIGWYDKLIKLGGAGATVPLTGFGNLLATGVLEAVDQHGFLGIFTGAFQASAAGLCAAIIFGFIMSILFTPKG